MRVEDFVRSAGSFVPTLDGVLAFRPASLPPRFDMATLAEPLGDARGAIGRIKVLGPSAPARRTAMSTTPPEQSHVA